MEVIVPVRCDYFGLSPTCGYCPKAADSLRVTTMLDGRIHVLSVCQKCAVGERTTQIALGWRAIRGTSTIVNTELLEDLPEDVRATFEPEGCDTSVRRKDVVPSA